MCEGIGAKGVEEYAARLGRAALPTDDAAIVDELRALETLKCAAEARQAELAVTLDASQREQQAAAGVPPERQGQGVGAQVALARRESPHRGNVHVQLARRLASEMPCTRAAFRAGRISEWRATIIARETACLSLEHREVIDEAIAADPERLETMGDRQLVAEIGRLAAHLDAKAVAERRASAERERRVTVRPAPDTMGRLTGLLPVAQAVAAWAALKAEADRLKASGDPRTRDQIMADTLVARVTSPTGSAGRPVVPVALNVTMSLEALLDGAHDEALLEGVGVIPAGAARALLADALDAGVKVWLRRLLIRPRTGELVGMDAKARLFPAALGRWLELRDQFCRSPYCDAPVRHHDHVIGAADGGPTAADNGQGLCEACNYAKQAPGWRSRPVAGPRHTVATTTPTGHTYHSQAPPLPGAVVTARHLFVGPAFAGLDAEAS